MPQNFNAKFFFTFLFLFFISLFHSQILVSGEILDSLKQKPATEVSIFINENSKPLIVTSGNFKISSDSLIYKLRFQKKGFQLKTVNFSSKNTQNLKIVLRPESVENIQEVIIQGKAIKYKNKKENPAYAIMQKVWAHKKKNGLDNYKTYQYQEYEKIQFDLNNIDSIFMKRKIFNKVDFIFKYADSASNGKLSLPMFLNESIYKIYGENQPHKKVKKELVAQKTSGFQDNQIMATTVKNLYKEINIYDNTLNYFNIGFQSPVSTDGFSTYDYNLIDSLSIRGEDCYHIKYFPKRKDILAFTGDLFISKNNFAVVKVSLKSTKKMNVNFVNAIFTELEFDNPDDNTFLPFKNTTQFDISLVSKNKNARGMLAKRTINYSDYQFNKVIPEQIFENKEPKTNEELTRSDVFWEENRTDSLNVAENNVYKMLSQLQEVPKFKRFVKIYETLSSGYYNVGHSIDIGNLYSIFGNNAIEGNRLRLGARTYFSANDDWRIQGYGAYGFKDHQFKYGVEAKYMFNKINRFQIGVGTRRDILQLGVGLTDDDGIMSRSFASSSLFSRGDNVSLSNVNQTSFYTSIEPWKNFQVRIDGTLESIKSADNQAFNLKYLDNENQVRKTVNDSHLTLSLIANPGAKFSETGIDRYSHTTLSPTFVLKYTRGLKGLFNADFNYNKLQFLYTQPILLGTWGKSKVNMELGKNFDTVPLALQNIIPGNQSYNLIPNTFSQLNYYEFVADSYATINIEHHFNGKILSYIPLIKKLKLREIGLFRAAYGTLSNASKVINLSSIQYSAPSEHVYYEYGFGIENIGFGNLRILRVDFNWRGNYLDRPGITRFGIKAGFQVNF
ncbi:DUF5686 family protein [Halpernia sp.]|uniref:DUF5686 family protein n=1 Tax=Halpernia sp. TaxID=2782209 RepID=UPI003A9218FE